MHLAFALLLVGALPGDPVPSAASNARSDASGNGPRDERPGWSALDARLLDELAADGSGSLRWGALVRAFGTRSQAASTGGEDAAGFVLEDVDVHLAGGAEALSWRLSFDLASDTAVLEDAHGRWTPAVGWELVVGQFKPRVARSASVAPEGLLFRDRTFLGATFDVWDAGVEIGRHYDQFDFWFALTNAEDATLPEDSWSFRVEWALYDAAFEDVEGARGAPNHLRVLLGGFLFDDTALASSGAGGAGLDLAFQLGPWAFLGEWASLGDSFVRDVDVRDGTVVSMGDGSPWAIVVSRRCGEDWESAVRLERAGDVDDTRALGLVTSFSSATARWSLEVERVRADPDDDTRVSLGVQMGASGIARPLAGNDPFGAPLPIGLR